MKKYLKELDDKKYTPIKKRNTQTFDEFSARASEKKGVDYNQTLKDKRDMRSLGSFMT